MSRFLIAGKITLLYNEYNRIPGQSMQHTLLHPINQQYPPYPAKVRSFEQSGIRSSLKTGRQAGKESCLPTSPLKYYFRHPCTTPYQHRPCRSSCPVLSCSHKSGLSTTVASVCYSTLGMDILRQTSKTMLNSSHLGVSGESPLGL